MKLRSFLSALATVVVVLLVTSVAGFVWLFSQNPLSLLQTAQAATPSAAMFVPKQAPLVTSLLVNPDRLESFRQVVVRPEERRRARSEIAQIKQGLLANTGLDYQRDVQPWLGDEMTLAVTSLDIDRDAENGAQPGYLLALATKDPERSREFLQLFWQKRAIGGTDLVFEQYKGIKLIYGNQPDEVDTSQKRKRRKSGFPSFSIEPLNLASAVVGDQFVLFANHPKVLRDAINNVQAPDLNLLSTDFYTQSLEALTQPRLGLAFVNVPRFATWWGDQTALPSKSAKAETEGTPATGTQTLAIALELERTGLLASTALVSPSSTATSTASLSKPVQALQYLPATVPFAAAGQDLDRVWTQLSQGAATYGTTAELLNQSLADLERRWKLDLPQDVFSWVKGEFALGLLPEPGANPPRRGKNKSLPANQNDWIFVAERSNSDTAKQAIAGLDEIAQQQGLSIGAIQLGNQTVSAWTRFKPEAAIQQASKTLQAKVEGVHASVGNYEIFTTSIAAMDAALKAVDHPLSSDDRFQQAIAPLAEPNNGYLYLDWASSRSTLERQFPVLKVIELAGKPLFKHLDALTLSSYGSRSGIQQGGVFFKLN